MKRLTTQSSPKRLDQWFHVSFDSERVYIRAEPFVRAPWAQEFAWSTVVRICFKAEDLRMSDGIYVFTTQRPESYVIPTEAEGGSELWAEIIRRGLFDPQLALDVLRSPGGLFVWPPYESTRKANA
jgi:hypothetical protein